MSVYLTLEQVAENLQMSRQAVLALSRRGELPRPIRFGRRTYRFDLVDIQCVLVRKHAEAESSLDA